MRANAALVLAICSGAAAVALIAVDLRFSLIVRLDERDGDGWQTASTSSGGYQEYPKFYAPEECVGPELRVVLVNDKPLPDRVELYVYYTYGTTYQVQTVVRETWNLGAFEERSHEFTIPADYFEYTRPPNGSTERPAPVGVTLTIQADTNFLSRCVTEAA